MGEWDARIWIALVGMIGGAITVLGAILRSAIKGRATSEAAAQKSAASALWADADRMRDHVFARLNAQETRLGSLQAQLDGAREALLDARGEIASLRAELDQERIARVAAESRERALKDELDELLRALRAGR